MTYDPPTDNPGDWSEPNRGQLDTPVTFDADEQGNPPARAKVPLAGHPPVLAEELDHVED